MILLLSFYIVGGYCIKAPNFLDKIIHYLDKISGMSYSFG